ncbi:hypothetical protein HN587_00180 [Candidatus Woesearchaeota archaeon]|jgi:DNA repair protein NreA|nr:hypothetical protein [Candidatus Woesearchaeota archaeon]
MNVQCLKCKGRNFCNRPVCPIRTKLNSQKKVNISAKQDFFGESPNVFVGKFGYPKVNVGFLSVEQYEDHDAPLKWSLENKQINEIIDLRTSLINSQFKANIKGFDDRLVEISQEVSLASKPVDVEINLNKKPSFDLNFNQDTMPHGPNVKINKIKITENTKIPLAVDKLVNDCVSATDAVSLLYKKNFDEHYLTKILSVGNLGFDKNKKLVPTRWSITAVDDIIGKKLISEIKDNSQMGYFAWFGGYLGNYYLVLSFPDVWRYELFEMLANQPQVVGVGANLSFATDYEDHGGRREYAHSTAGGYYAARIAILEKLKLLKKQGSILCLRFITDEYWAPLGVWVCRNATRKSLNSFGGGGLEFGSRELLIDYAIKLARKKFSFNLEPILRQSKLLNEVKLQKKLFEF